jgi:putative two-component system response regulator
VCDVYDALRTNRPYRAAWEPDKVLKYIEEKAGSEFEPEITMQFVQMMRQLEGRISAVEYPAIAEEAVPAAS